MAEHPLLTRRARTSWVFMFTHCSRYCWFWCCFMLCSDRHGWSTTAFVSFSGWLFSSCMLNWCGWVRCFWQWRWCMRLWDRGGFWGMTRRGSLGWFTYFESIIRCLCSCVTLQLESVPELVLYERVDLVVVLLCSFSLLVVDCVLLLLVVVGSCFFPLSEETGVVTLDFVEDWCLLLTDVVFSTFFLSVETPLSLVFVFVSFSASDKVEGSFLFSIIWLPRWCALPGVIIGDSIRSFLCWICYMI